MYISFLAKNWKPVGAAVLLVIVAITAYYYGKGNVEEKIVVKTEVVEKIIEKETKNTHKTRNTEIIKTPDGAEKIVIREEEDTTAVIDRETDKKESHKSASEKKPLSRFRTGVIASAPLNDIKDIKNITAQYSLVVGVRAVGPVWIDGLYTHSRREIGIGVSIEF